MAAMADPGGHPDNTPQEQWERQMATGLVLVAASVVIFVVLDFVLEGFLRRNSN